MAQADVPSNAPAEVPTPPHWPRFKKALGHLPRWLALAVVAFGFAFVLLVAMRTYDFLKQFNDAVDVLTDKYGINTLLAKALAAILFVPLAVGAKRGFFQQFGKHGVRASLVAGAYAAAYFLGMYAVSRNAAFSHKEGRVLQWFAETPEGVRFFDSPGFDTKYGISLKPVTPEMKVALARRQLGQVPHSVPVVDLPQLQLFDPITAAPRYWFYKSPTGDFELFDGPGFHPQNQALLLQLNSQVASEIVAWLQRKQAETRQASRVALLESREASRLAFIDRYLDQSTRRTSGTKQWAVLITDSANVDVPTLTATGREVLVGKGARSVLPFRPQFLRDRLNDELFGGNASLVHRLSLDQFCEGVILGKFRISLSNSGDVQGLITARTSLLVRLVSASTGSVLHEFELNSLGAGFSGEAAKSQATERLASGLRNRLVAVLP